MGGTISSVDPDGKGAETTLAGEALVSAVSFRQAASPELTVKDLAEMAVEIVGRIDGGVPGRSSSKAQTP